MSIREFAVAAALAVVLGGCSSPTPLSYAPDRCTGQHNQCQLDCAGLKDGPARAACIERCYDVENQCLSSGYNGSGSSLSIDRAAAAARSRAEREAEFEEWRAQRQRERAESGEGDVEIQVIEPEDKKD